MTNTDDKAVTTLRIPYLNGPFSGSELVIQDLPLAALEQNGFIPVSERTRLQGIIELQDMWLAKLGGCTGCGSPHCGHLWPEQKKCCPDCSHGCTAVDRMTSWPCCLTGAHTRHVFSAPKKPVEPPACTCHSCEVLPQLHEQVAQMCEFLGSKRDAVPCDSWHLRDLISKLQTNHKSLLAAHTTVSRENDRLKDQVSELNSAIKIKVGPQHTCTLTAATINGQPPPPCEACRLFVEEHGMPIARAAGAVRIDEDGCCATCGATTGMVPKWTGEKELAEVRALLVATRTDRDAERTQKEALRMTLDELTEKALALRAERDELKVQTVKFLTFVREHGHRFFSTLHSECDTANLEHKIKATSAMAQWQEFRVAAQQPAEAAPVAKEHDERGLYRKFLVERLSDPTGKHRDCTYFVLDEVHDKYAGVALRAYADACEGEFGQLARDLRARHPVAKAEAPSEPAGWVPKVGDPVVIIDFSRHHGREFPVHSLGAAGSVRVELADGSILSLLPTDVAPVEPAPQPPATTGGAKPCQKSGACIHPDGHWYPCSSEPDRPVMMGELVAALRKLPGNELLADELEREVGGG